MCEAATPLLTIDLDESEKEKVQFRLISGKSDDRRRLRGHLKSLSFKLPAFAGRD